MEQNHCTTKTGKWKQLTERDRYKIEALNCNIKSDSRA